MTTPRDDNEKGVDDLTGDARALDRGGGDTTFVSYIASRKLPHEQVPDDEEYLGVATGELYDPDWRGKV